MVRMIGMSSPMPPIAAAALAPGMMRQCCECVGLFCELTCFIMTVLSAFYTPAAVLWPPADASNRVRLTAAQPVFQPPRVARESIDIRYDCMVSYLHGTGRAADRYL